MVTAAGAACCKRATACEKVERRAARKGATLVRRPRTAVDRRAPRDLEIPEGCSLFAVVRDGRAVPLRPDTVLAEGDKVIAIGRAECEAAVERLKWAIDMTAILGGEILCGPYHSPLAVFSGTGPTPDEKKRAADVLRQAAEGEWQLLGEVPRKQGLPARAARTQAILDATDGAAHSGEVYAALLRSEWRVAQDWTPPDHRPRRA